MPERQGIPLTPLEIGLRVNFQANFGQKEENHLLTSPGWGNLSFSDFEILPQPAPRKSTLRVQNQLRIESFAPLMTFVKNSMRQIIEKGAQISDGKIPDLY